MPRLFFAEQAGAEQAGAEQAGAAAPEPPSGQGQLRASGPAGQPGGPPPAQGRPWGPPPAQGRPGGPPPAQGQPWGPPPQQPAPLAQRRTRPPDRELRQRALAALVLAMLGLFAVLLGYNSISHRGVYLLIFGAVVGVAASVIGITALVKANRTRSLRPRGAVLGIILGSLATLIAIPAIVFYLVFPKQLDNYVSCVSQAQTTSQRQACFDKFVNSTQATMLRPAGGASATARSGQR